MERKRGKDLTERECDVKQCFYMDTLGRCLPMPHKKPLSLVKFGFLLQLKTIILFLHKQKGTGVLYSLVV